MSFFEAAVMFVSGIFCYGVLRLFIQSQKMSLVIKDTFSKIISIIAAFEQANIELLIAEREQRFLNFPEDKAGHLQKFENDLIKVNNYINMLFVSIIAAAPKSYKRLIPFDNFQKAKLWALDELAKKAEYTK